jgi:hypothetical protein
MSLSAISSAASTVLSAVGFHPHGHRRGAQADKSSTSSTSSITGSTSGIPIGQLPVGASTPLFNNILQSLQQTVGAAAAVSGVAPAAATTAGTAGATAASGSTSTNGARANVQAFMHTLFQALKQDGLGAGTSGAVPSGAAPSGAAPATSALPSGATPAAAGGQYQANLVASLQTLVRQVGSGTAANSATANLNAAYQNLMNTAGAGTSAASSGAAANQSSTTALQNFLNNLLQNLQSGGVHSLSGVGNNLNASV